MQHIVLAPRQPRERIDLNEKLGVEHRFAGRGLHTQQQVVVVVAEALGIALVVVQVGVAGWVEVVEIVIEAQLGDEISAHGREQAQHKQGEMGVTTKGHWQKLLAGSG